MSVPTDMESLQLVMKNLQRENEYLKGLLDAAGISYDTDSFCVEKADLCVSKDNEMIFPGEITIDHARKFFSYFWGRMDVFAKRWQNKKNGKAGYYTQCDNFWQRGVCPKASKVKKPCRECVNRKWTRLSPQHIIAHLKGEKDDCSDVIGIYPIFPDNTCRFMVFDFDNHTASGDLVDSANLDNAWMYEANALREICKQNGIPALVERSRSGCGAHVWIFFAKPIQAPLVRKFGFALLEKGAETVNLKSFKYYDRMIPAQDELAHDGLGNLIALPLQGKALKEGNSAFVNKKWQAYADQWQILANVKVISKDMLESCLIKWKNDMQNEVRQGGLLEQVDNTKPWQRTTVFSSEDVDGAIKLVQSNRLYIASSNLKPRIQNQIRRLAVFANPKFFKNKAMGLSNYTNSRYVYLGEDEAGYICLPRGVLDALQEKCTQADINIEIEDLRVSGRRIDVSFTGELKLSQFYAADTLMHYDNGILSAATAFGKTVVCCNIIATKQVNALILLESSALVEQWKKAIDEFLDINEELPVYTTKTGRVKKRKSLVGVIQAGKNTATGIVDIGMVGSLKNIEKYGELLKSYGLVIVDECHHSASDTMRAVLQEVAAKYLYGVTATPFRGDGMDKINYMLLGAVRYKYSAKERGEEQGIPHWLVPRFTRVVWPYGRNKIHINKAYELIRSHENRNQQIVDDIRLCVEGKRSILVLTRFIEHAKILYKMIQGMADKVFLLTGMGRKQEQQNIYGGIAEVKETESLVIIATGQLVGEGFDCPRLDTLIMATPIAWKGLVEQYVGRLNRDYPNKQDVKVYDYIDSHIPVFDNMYLKRLRTYKRIGYKIFSDAVGSMKDTVNAIYDTDSYLPVFESDMQNAGKSIVISSPRLNRHKVMWLLRIIKPSQVRGVSVTVVTWYPDEDKYGKQEHRIELLEELTRAGVHVELLEENCKHFAVIDTQIVWYGNMNLLAKDDVEDEMMRLCSTDIAVELLETTFMKENRLREYMLPL